MPPLPLTTKSTVFRLKFRPGAYKFVDAALRYTQKKLDRKPTPGGGETDAHISGPELLDGIRELALKQFGLLTLVVFRHWGVRTTEDFGRIVFEFIEQGVMRKTEQDQLSDFFEVYDFDDVFDRDYEIDVAKAFRH